MVRKRRFTRFSRFRRRGRGGTWFPSLGTFWGDDTTYHDTAFSGDTEPVADNRGEGPTQNVFPVTRDFTQFGSTGVLNSEPSLRDIVEGQTWRLNRIVGELHLATNESNTEVSNDIWGNIEIAAGFFVARASDADQALPDLTFDEIDPLNARNAQNSWIWRKSWILGRPLQSNVGYPAVPISNMEMNELSGPHIDSKVKRNIRREHRLWFAIGTIGWDGNAVSRTPITHSQPWVRFHLDIRIHGMLKRGRESASF